MWVLQGKMIVLDLYSEVTPQYQRLKSYFGQPFIWCMLHNFGGTLPMYGDIQSVNEVIASVTAIPKVGLGLGLGSGWGLGSGLGLRLG